MFSEKRHNFVIVQEVWCEIWYNIFLASVRVALLSSIFKLVQFQPSKNVLEVPVQARLGGLIMDIGQK